MTKIFGKTLQSYFFTSLDLFPLAKRNNLFLWVSSFKKNTNEYLKADIIMKLKELQKLLNLL